MFEAFSRSLVDFFGVKWFSRWCCCCLVALCLKSIFHHPPNFVVNDQNRATAEDFYSHPDSVFFVSYHPWSNRLRKNNRRGGWVCCFSIDFSTVLRKWSEVNWNNKKVNNFLASHFSPLKTACKLWLLVERDVLSFSTVASGFKLCTTRFDLSSQSSIAPLALLVTVPLFILWQVRNNLRHRISHFLALVCAELVYFLASRFKVCAKKNIFCIFAVFSTRLGRFVLSNISHIWL